VHKRACFVHDIPMLFPNRAILVPDDVTLVSDGASLAPMAQHWCMIEQNFVHDRAILVPDDNISCLGMQLWYPIEQISC
jgi:hypothetical protein